LEFTIKTTQKIDPSPWKIQRFGGVVATRNLIVGVDFVGYLTDQILQK
jgi:hypothetical protein